MASFSEKVAVIAAEFRRTGCRGGEGTPQEVIALRRRCVDAAADVSC